jgi:hypothetical protein
MKNFSAEIHDKLVTKLIYYSDFIASAYTLQSQKIKST